MADIIGYLFFLLALIKPLNAVFSDEAYNVDWQLQNLGSAYKCVMADEESNHLAIVSEWRDQSLLSFLDKNSGSIIFRELLPYHIQDVMHIGDEIYLLNEDGIVDVYDSQHGFKKEVGVEVKEFQSSCNPNLKNVKVEKSEVRIVDEKSNMDVFKFDLDENFEKILFFNSDYATKMEVLVKYSGNRFAFYNYLNDTISKRWTRDESLSTIVDQVILDVADESLEPTEHEISVETSIPQVWKAYLYRLSTNSERFIKYLERFNYNPGKIITNLLGMDADAEDLATIQDQNMRFGYLKQLIVITDNGALQALDMLNKGAVKWSITTGINNPIRIFFSDAFRDLTVFGKDGSYKIYKVDNSLHIKESISGSIGSPIESVQPFLVDNSTDKFVVKFTNGSKKVISTTEKRISLDGNPVFITDHTKFTVEGFAVDKDGNAKSTWKYKVQPDEEIVSFRQRESKRTVNVGTVLGSRDVLYKYLYPNLAAFAIVNKQSQKLTTNLIDTVTGQILHSQFHDDKMDTDFPVNIIFGENWYIYSYFSMAPLPEQKIGVVELYESLTPNQKFSNNTGLTEAMAGVHKPAAIANTFYFPDIIKRLELSETKYDITTKAVIIVLENGQITYVPKFLLNARRVEESKMSDDDKKEFMATPYVPGIPLTDNLILSHYRDVILGEEIKIVSSATNLESTSNVCAIGLDVFCTRITPSGQFDVMSPGFEKGTLLTTIGVLFLICVALRPYGASKKLKAIWTVRD
ncbi:ER membrane protein complex subunit 1, C-terminal [Nakaseomyces glabratus]|nr:ER membrane protein complex subunit 1, C-terminal [Nakaseomyces glabratus]KAH7598150.1 ER membrane protein complex subunit 1, C-terminal [Nakaseomyces glabratus]KAI8400759.1 ER membrane protein complex subunit 1, C-terminal [Nakaseomyces glabratus]KTB16449.1 ER membrane protein complex subunit 1 [Nakaseomyces glabratus]KTB16795.1 ER membrane protein complex subunit 1 [Nakaseomyces glabratus]